MSFPNTNFLRGELGKLRVEQLKALWQMVTAAPLADDEKAPYRTSAVEAIGELLSSPGNKVWRYEYIV